MSLGKIFSIKYVTTFVFVLMCINYIPLETRSSISLVKVGVSAFVILFFLGYSPKLSKALLWGGLYFLLVMFSALLNIESFRASTVLYLASFIGLFVAFYNFIHLEKVFDLDYFIELIKKLILAYAILLLIQQCFIVVGIKQFSLINLTQILGRGIGANSLGAEPSSSARILTVLFLSLLRMYEVKFGKENVNLKLIWDNSKWVVLGFLWCMLTMGSGTAFIGLAMLSLYFIKKQYVLTIVPLIAILYFAAPYIDFEPLQRARVVFDAAITLDQSVVVKVDRSAAYRVVPLINTLTELDLTDSQTWLGLGVDNGGKNISAFSSQSTIGGISSYGLLSYVFALIFMFRCIIYRVFSLETLVCFVLVGLTINNFAYIWGIYMILSTSRYFQEISPRDHQKSII